MLRSLVLLLVACVIVSGCVVSGNSPREIKYALQESFLYRSIEAFAVQSALGGFDMNAKLSGEQVVAVRREYQKLIHGLLISHSKNAAQLASSFKLITQPTHAPVVVMPNYDLDAPKIDADGQIYIDIRIARQMFRDAVLASMKHKGTDYFSRDYWLNLCGNRLGQDAEYLKCFFELKHRIDTIEAQTVIGAAIDRRTWGLKESAPFFNAADLFMNSEDLRARYAGVMLFVTAHEIGHVVLGHISSQKNGKRFSSAELHQAEFDADEYALRLFSSALPEMAYLQNFDIKNLITGYEDFFTQTYSNAHWIESDISHPPSAQRLSRLRALHNTLARSPQHQFFDALTLTLTKTLENSTLTSTPSKP
jgi:hypothetical protein